MNLFKCCTFALCLLWGVNISFALTLEESINLAIQNSIELKIETQNKDLTAVSKLDAASMFLPNIEAGYRKGNRNTTFASSADRSLAEDVKSATLTQPLFNGFQGIATVRKAIHQTNAANYNLIVKKNDIALETIFAYLNTLKLRKVTALQLESLKYYDVILELAKQKLSLAEIPYSEFTEHEVLSQRILLSHNTNSIALQENELRFANLTNQPPQGLSDIQTFTDISPLEILLENAKTNNPNIKMSEATLKAAKIAVAAQKGKFAPKVSLVMQYEDHKASYYFNGQGYTNKAAYINVQIPLFQSGAEYSAVIKANKQKQIASLEHELTIKQIETALKEEYYRYASLKQTLALLKKTAVNVENSLKLANERFLKKDIGRLDLLRKQVDVNDVRIQTINVEYDVILSYYRLKMLIDGLFISNNLMQ